MSDSAKDITVKNIESSGMTKMIGGIFKYITGVHRDMLGIKQDILNQGRELYKRLKKEYKRAERPRAFFGTITSRELLEEANSYAISEMKKFFRGFREVDDTMISGFVRLAKESPEEFFKALRVVLADDGRPQDLSEPKAGYINKVDEIIQALHQHGGEEDHERELFDKKRKSFVEIAEDTPAQGTYRPE